jgi:hypothetical protein
MDAAASSSSAWRRPVMKTKAPSATNRRGGREPDTAVPAGYDGDFSFKLAHCGLLCSAAAEPLPGGTPAVITTAAATRFPRRHPRMRPVFLGQVVAGVLHDPVLARTGLRRSTDRFPMSAASGR